MTSAIGYSPGPRKVRIRVGDGRHARPWLELRGRARLVVGSSTRPNRSPSPLGVSFSGGLPRVPGFCHRRDNKGASICKFLHSWLVPWCPALPGIFFQDDLNLKSLFYSILRDGEVATDNTGLALRLRVGRAYERGRYPNGHRENGSVGRLFSEPKPREVVRGHQSVRTLRASQPRVWRGYISAGSRWRQGTVSVGPEVG
jgi:hypothetical protein